MLSEISQDQKDKYHMFNIVFGIYTHTHTHTHTYM
jgi:hypothetical protein